MGHEAEAIQCQEAQEGFLQTITVPRLRGLAAQQKQRSGRAPVGWDWFGISDAGLLWNLRNKRIFLAFMHRVAFGGNDQGARRMGLRMFVISDSARDVAVLEAPLNMQRK